MKKKNISADAVIPINALFDEGLGPNLARDPRPDLRTADVIMGVDVMTRTQFLVFGRKTLEKIAKGKTAKTCSVLTIGLDQDSIELEKLLALVQVLRGRHDYES